MNAFRRRGRAGTSAGAGRFPGAAELQDAAARRALEDMVRSGRIFGHGRCGRRPDHPRPQLRTEAESARPAYWRFEGLGVGPPSGGFHWPSTRRFLNTGGPGRSYPPPCDESVYSLEIAAETSATKPGTVAFRMSRSWLKLRPRSAACCSSFVKTTACSWRKISIRKD